MQGDNMKGVPGTENISFCNTDKVFKVTKRFNGPQKFLGSSKTLIGALMIRDWCQVNNWEKYPKSDTKSTEPYIRVQEKADPIYRYRVAKVINGHEYSFGSFPTLKEAKECRNNCINHNWSLELLPSNPLRFIQFVLRKDGIIKYNIHRKEGNTSINYGLFDTVHEAMAERDLLEQCNWDYDAVCESLDDTLDGRILFLNGKKSNMRIPFEKQPRNDFWYAKNNKMLVGFNE